MRRDRVTQLSSSNPLGCIDGVPHLVLYFHQYLYCCAGGENFIKGFRQRFNEGMSDQQSQTFIEVHRAPQCLHKLLPALCTWRCTTRFLRQTLSVARCDQLLQGLIATAEQNFSMRMYDGVQKLLGTQD